MTDRRFYLWDSDSSLPELPRTVLRAEILNILLDGKGVVLYGGHGMGKSVLIKQLLSDLSSHDHVHVAAFVPSSEASPLTQLSELLGQPDADSESTLIGDWCARHPHKTLVLLYDEVDAYIQRSEAGRAFFHALEAARKAANTRVGILAAGGLGLVALEHTWASPFVGRARAFFALRFSPDEVATLAEPLQVSDPTVLDVLHAQTGGIPALCVYGLRGLLETPAIKRTPRRVNEIFSDFLERHESFRDSVWAALGAESDQDGPSRMWRVLRDNAGIQTDIELAQEMGLSHQATKRGVKILKAAGLIETARLRGGVRPLRLVPSILSLPDPIQPTRYETLSEQLHADLVLALQYIGRWGPTCYIREKEPMPEAVFQAAISITLSARGWTHVVHESAQGAGRADIIAEYPDFEGQQALIEVKIWPRGDYKKIQLQVESYRVSETTAIATVMIAIKQNLAFEEYQSTCFDGDGKEMEVPRPLIALRGVTKSQDYPPLPIDHFLLKLQRRR